MVHPTRIPPRARSGDARCPKDQTGELAEAALPGQDRGTAGIIIADRLPRRHPTASVTLHPALLIARSQELIAEICGRLAGAGRQNDETVPNAIATDIHRLCLAVPLAQ